MMEISFNRKTFGCYNKAAELYDTVGTSAECVVPDTQEDIKQILTAYFASKIKSKDFDADEVSIKAEIKATVLYYSDNGIETLELSLPLSEKIPYKDSDPKCRLKAAIRIEDWTVRLINPRKISLKADVGISMSVYKESEISLFEKADSLPEKMFLKSENISANIIDTVSEKEITLTEEFEVNSASDQKFIFAKTDYNYENSEAVGDKLVIRCAAEVNALYLSDGKLLFNKTAFPFSQIFDISGEDEGTADVDIISTGEYYDFSDGILTAEIHALIQLVHYENKEICFASDAYSCEAETAINFESTELCTERSSAMLKESFSLELDSQHVISEIILLKAEEGRPNIVDNTVTIPIMAEIIYTDPENDIYCEKLRGTVKIPLDDEGNYNITSVKITDIKSELSGNKVIIKGELRLNLSKCSSNIINSIASIEEGETLAKAAVSAYIVFSEEDIWSMAKKYKSSSDAIKEIEFEGNNKYFVPVIK